MGNDALDPAVDVLTMLRDDWRGIRDEAFRRKESADDEYVRACDMTDALTAAINLLPPS